MKHLCKDCIYCNFVAKDLLGYETSCRFRPDWVITGKVKRCVLHTTVKILDEEKLQTILETTNFMGK